MSTPQAIFFGMLLALTPSLAALAFLLWRQHSTRLLIEKQPDLLEDQLAVDLRGLIPIIVKDSHTMNEAEIAARHHLVNSCRAVLTAVGFNVLKTGTVSPPPASIENGGK